ncbi:MAG: hypothetical protein J2P24_08265 [Streptosporangiales bacterium]|nr:hypothetical protein [Streptosporangiales bacterium]
MDLAELIRRNKGERSFDTLAVDCGNRPTSQRIQQIASSRRLANFPDPDSIRGLAKGLGVTEWAVVQAAAVSVGLRVDESPSRLADLLPVDADRIPERIQDAFLSVVRAVIAREREFEQATDGDGLMRPLLQERGVAPGAGKAAARRRPKRPAASGE